MVLLQRKLYFSILFQGSRGGPTFSRVSNFFQGVQLLISIEIHILCDFPGGSGPPIPPLEPHMSLNKPTNLHTKFQSNNYDKRFGGTERKHLGLQIYDGPG